jgi:hypothetical protein
MTQAVPMLATGVVVSTQVWAPVEHEVVPRTHWFALVEQARPGVHGLQTPDPLQTMFAPQPVPAASGVAVSTQVSVPVAHELTPT